jgi:hypothetical protein
MNDDKSLQSIDNWLSGTSDNLPQDLKLAVKDLMVKLQFSQGSLMVSQLKRSMRLIQTINMLEEELTSPQYLLTLEPQAKMKILEYCTNNLNKNMESINRFMMANADARDYIDPKTKTLQNLLMSLSAEEIDQILAMLEDN